MQLVYIVFPGSAHPYLNYIGCQPVACRLVHSFGPNVQICGHVAHPTAFPPILVVVCFPQF